MDFRQNISQNNQSPSSLTTAHQVYITFPFVKISPGVLVCMKKGKREIKEGKKRERKRERIRFYAFLFPKKIKIFLASAEVSKVAHGMASSSGSGDPSSKPDKVDSFINYAFSLHLLISRCLIINVV